MEDCTRVVHNLTMTTPMQNIADTPPLPQRVPNVHVLPMTPTSTFMQERPAGPVQTNNEQMKALTCRVTAQLQKKSTTATEGRAGYKV